MPAFPAKATITDPAVQNGNALSWFGSLWDAVTGLLGSDGTLATARATLLEPGASGTIPVSNGTDIVWTPQAAGKHFFFARSVTEDRQLDATGATAGSVTVGFGDEVYDDGGVYDGVNTFTAPEDGLYVFGATVQFDGDTTHEVFCTFSMTGPGDLTFFHHSAMPPCLPGDGHTVTGMTVLDLDADETVSVSINAQDGDQDMNIGYSDKGLFYGYLLRARPV